MGKERETKNNTGPSFTREVVWIVLLLSEFRALSLCTQARVSNLQKMRIPQPIQQKERTWRSFPFEGIGWYKSTAIPVTYFNLPIFYSLAPSFSIIVSKSMASFLFFFSLVFLSHRFCLGLRPTTHHLSLSFAPAEKVDDFKTSPISSLQKLKLLMVHM